MVERVLMYTLGSHLQSCGWRLDIFFFNYMNVFFEMGLGVFVFSLYKFATHYFGHIHTDTCIHLHIHAHTIDT